MTNDIINNISSLASPALINSAKSQLVSQAKDKVKQTILTKADELKQKGEELAQKRANIEIDYRKGLETLQSDYKAGNITEKDKTEKEQALQTTKDEALKVIDAEIKKVKDDIINSIKDPLKKAKEKKKKLDDKINKNTKKSKKDRAKANALRNKQILRNVQKTIAPIIIGQITNILVRIASQNSRLQELVDKTNEIIDTANTPESINQARVLRNNALTIINSQEKKLLSIRDVIKTLNIIITIIQTIITLIKIIFSIPKPFGLGPTMPTPIASKLNKLQMLIEALGVALSITLALLEQAIAILEDLKLQLHDISDLLDGKTSNLPIPLDLGLNFGTNLGTYKGFKFALREDNDPKFNVRGNKRHYAVAIDKNNVDVLKSEYSFTLDPNDLIDQLKLVIDSQNLIA
jgi:hypothetical protein